MYDYTRVSDKFISSALDVSVSSYLSDPCYNLSAILGDTNSLIPPNAVNQLLKSLTIISPGIVLMGEDVNKSNIDNIIPSEEFMGDICEYAFEIYNLFLIGDTTVVSSTSVSDYSPLLKLSTSLSPNIRNAISSIYLESLSLYKEVLSVTSIDRMKSVTLKDLGRIDNNIRWTSDIIENLTLTKHYELLSVLRDLQRTVSYVGSITSIFSTTYKRQLDEFDEWTRGVDNV